MTPQWVSCIKSVRNLWVESIDLSVAGKKNKPNSCVWEKQFLISFENQTISIVRARLKFKMFVETPYNLNHPIL